MDGGAGKGRSSWNDECIYVPDSESEESWQEKGQEEGGHEKGQEEEEHEKGEYEEGEGGEGKKERLQSSEVMGCMYVRLHETCREDRRDVEDGVSGRRSRKNSYTQSRSHRHADEDPTDAGAPASVLNSSRNDIDMRNGAVQQGRGHEEERSEVFGHCDVQGLDAVTHEGRGHSWRGSDGGDFLTRQARGREGGTGGAVLGHVQGPDAAGMETREDPGSGGAVLFGDFDEPSFSLTPQEAAVGDRQEKEGRQGEQGKVEAEPATGQTAETPPRLQQEGSAELAGRTGLEDFAVGDFDAPSFSLGPWELNEAEQELDDTQAGAGRVSSDEGVGTLPGEEGRGRESSAGRACKGSGDKDRHGVEDVDRHDAECTDMSGAGAAARHSHGTQGTGAAEEGPCEIEEWPSESDDAIEASSPEAPLTSSARKWRRQQKATHSPGGLHRKGNRHNHSPRLGLSHSHTFSNRRRHSESLTQSPGHAEEEEEWQEESGVDEKMRTPGPAIARSDTGAGVGEAGGSGRKWKRLKRKVSQDSAGVEGIRTGAEGSVGKEGHGGSARKGLDVPARGEAGLQRAAIPVVVIESSQPEEEEGAAPTWGEGHGAPAKQGADAAPAQQGPDPAPAQQAPAELDEIEEDSDGSPLVSRYGASALKKRKTPRLPGVGAQRRPGPQPGAENGESAQEIASRAGRERVEVAHGPAATKKPKAAEMPGVSGPERTGLQLRIQKGEAQEDGYRGPNGQVAQGAGHGVLAEAVMVTPVVHRAQRHEREGEGRRRLPSPPSLDDSAQLCPSAKKGQTSSLSGVDDRLHKQGALRGDAGCKAPSPLQQSSSLFVSGQSPQGSRTVWGGSSAKAEDPLGSDTLLSASRQRAQGIRAGGGGGTASAQCSLGHCADLGRTAGASCRLPDAEADSDGDLRRTLFKEGLGVAGAEGHLPRKEVPVHMTEGGVGPVLEEIQGREERLGRGGVGEVQSFLATKEQACAREVRGRSGAPSTEDGGPVVNRDRGGPLLQARGRVLSTEGGGLPCKARERPLVQDTEEAGPDEPGASCFGGSVLGKRQEELSGELNTESGASALEARERWLVEDTEEPGRDEPSSSFLGGSALGERWGRLGRGTQEAPPKGPKDDILVALKAPRASLSSSSVLGDRWGRLGGRSQEMPLPGVPRVPTVASLGPSVLGERLDKQSGSSCEAPASGTPARNPKLAQGSSRPPEEPLASFYGGSVLRERWGRMGNARGGAQPTEVAGQAREEEEEDWRMSAGGGAREEEEDHWRRSTEGGAQEALAEVRQVANPPPAGSALGRDPGTGPDGFAEAPAWGELGKEVCEDEGRAGAEDGAGGTLRAEYDRSDGSGARAGAGADAYEIHEGTVDGEATGYDEGTGFREAHAWGDMERDGREDDGWAGGADLGTGDDVGVGTGFNRAPGFGVSAVWDQSGREGSAKANWTGGAGAGMGVDIDEGGMGAYADEGWDGGGETEGVECFDECVEPPPQDFEPLEDFDPLQDLLRRRLPYFQFVDDLEQNGAANGEEVHIDYR